VNCRQVAVQFLPGAEVALLARFAVKTMPRVVMFPHISFHFSGEPYHFPTIVALGVEAEMGHHFGINVADLGTFRPQFTGVSHRARTANFHHEV